MKQRKHSQIILFEPWSLGDCIIAAAFFRELQATTDVALACHPKWHSLIRSCLLETGSTPSLISIELPYTLRSVEKKFEVRSLRKLRPIELAHEDKTAVLNIRGDLRDYLAAKSLFPKCHLEVCGWIQFAARRIGMLDLPFQVGIFSVRNRYRAWASLLNIPYSTIEESYRKLQAITPKSRQVVIHIGAQWRSRQYPYVRELRSTLEKEGYDVVLVGGPGDTAPDEIPNEEILRPSERDLVQILRQSGCVISNDSGPMHLSAFLGCRTLAIARVANIFEWLPPATSYLASNAMPKGYQPDYRYNSDTKLDAWPSPSAIAMELKKQC